MCQGLRWGFRVGFQYNSPLTPAPAQAPQHPEVISEYLHKECILGRMLGPFPEPLQLPCLHINRFGVIPKGHNTGKFRLITDLSFPSGQNVNDGIDPGLCSLVYTTVDEVAAQAAALGRPSGSKQLLRNSYMIYLFCMYNIIPSVYGDLVEHLFGPSSISCSLHSFFVFPLHKFDIILSSLLILLNTREINLFA